MPLHDVGYRTWNARPSPWSRAWMLMMTTGCQLVWKGRGVRRLVYFAIIPVAYFGVALFAFEKAVEHPEWLGILRWFLRELPGNGMLPPGLLQRGTEGIQAIQLQESRYRVWSLLLLTLIRYPQGLLLVILVGMIAPGMIANDLRSRSHLLYFSRPITILEYLLGKSAVVWAYLLGLTALPAMTLYVVGVGLSSDLRVIFYTWDLPLRIIASTGVILVPTTALALALSSLSTESRNALYAWIAVWVAGWVIYSNVRITHTMAGEAKEQTSWWTCTSLYHILGNVQAWIFGLDTERSIVLMSGFILFAITIVSYIVMYRRVAAPLRS